MSEESTTPDLVELTRQILRAADRGDFDTILGLYVPNAVWEQRGIGTFEGTPAIRGFWEDYYRSYEDLQIKAEELLDLGNGVVLAVNHQRGRAVGSERYVEARYVFIYKFVRGKVVRVISDPDVDGGRAAAERLAEERG
jgi:ketosteroid isomerase-like protein